MTQNKQYKWRGASEFSKNDAQIVGERINYLIEKKDGEIRPEDIIKDAKAKSSSLHSFFEWDDMIAGEKWRLQKARVLIGSIVEVVIVEGIQQDTRSFFNVHNEKSERVYVTLKTATTNKDYTKQLIKDCEGYMKHFLNVLRMLRDNL